MSPALPPNFKHCLHLRLDTSRLIPCAKLMSSPTSFHKVSHRAVPASRRERNSFSTWEIMPAGTRPLAGSPANRGCCLELSANGTRHVTIKSCFKAALPCSHAPASSLRREMVGYGPESPSDLPSMITCDTTNFFGAGHWRWGKGNEIVLGDGGEFYLLLCLPALADVFSLVRALGRRFMYVHLSCETQVVHWVKGSRYMAMQFQ